MLSVSASQVSLLLCKALSEKGGEKNEETVTDDELLQIASVDFSKNPQMLIDLKEALEKEEKAEHLIFDMEESTLWVAW